MEEKKDKKAVSKDRILFTVMGLLAAGAAVCSVLLSRAGESRTVVVYSSSSQSAQSETELDPEDMRAASHSKNSTKSSSSRSSSEGTAAEIPDRGLPFGEDDESEDAEEERAISYPVDVNLADMEELCGINGIGEVKAQAILDYRSSVGKITDMEELLSISGIGEKTLEVLKEHLYVAPEDHAPLQQEEPAQNEETEPEGGEEENVQGEAADENAYDVPQESPPEEPEGPEPVDVNQAGWEELRDKLMIDGELARSITDLRETLGGRFTSDLELLYSDGMTREKLNELRPYIIIE
ncbi:MAG: helix-hairpin-helix domain-containing protein [Ruminococcus sp.]|nr:helix-hairpin-helix domain-containing protein [Ruminococcus sp.]